MASRILDHLEQPDNSTCQATAIAKVIGSQDIWKIRMDLLNMGTPGDPAVMGAYLKPRVLEYRYLDRATVQEISDWVSQGPSYEVITHGFTTRVGHVWGISDSDPQAKVFECDDPWYEFDFPAGQFTQYSGKNVRYSWRAIWAYCGAWSYQQARDWYASTPNYSEPCIWAHLICN